MRKTLFLAWVLLHAVMINAQDLINKPENKTSYGISIGGMFFPSAYGAPARGLDSPVINFFYEPNFVLPVVEFFINKKENFHHLVGCSFSYRKHEGGSKDGYYIYSYKGIYMYYNNQLLFRKYTKGFFIKSLYAGGGLIIAGKDIIGHWIWNNSTSDTILESTDKNLIGSFGISFGYKKNWNKFYFDFGINRSVLVAGMGEHVRYRNSLSIKEEYSAFLTPFDDSYLMLFGGESRSLTYFIKIGYKIK